jgi:predicted DCC family thiol-disulfide oxidoreductase YuxK
VKVVRGFRDFWFGETDLAPVALLRILYGVLLFNWFWQLYPNLTAFFTDEGFMPRAQLLTHFGNRWSLLDLSGDWWWVALFWLTSLAVAVMLTVGYRTRTASVLAFVAVSSFSWRNPFMLDGSDFVFRVVPIWLAFTNVGDKWGLDAVRRRARGDPPSGLGPALPVRILQLQIGWIYLATGLEKSAGHLWPEGTAAYYALQLKYTFGRAFVEPLARNDLFDRLVSWWTLAVELGFLPAAFFPFFQPAIRVLAVLAAGSLQLGILTMMNVGNFPLIMLVTLVVFLPEAFIERAVEWVGRFFRRHHVRLYYDGDCPLCVRTIRYLVGMDRYGTLEPIDFRKADARGIARPRELEQRIHAVDERGRVTSGYAALAAAARGIPVLVPLALIDAFPVGAALAERAYTAVAARRIPLSCDGSCAGVPSAAPEPPARRHRSPRMRVAGSLALGAFAALSFATAFPSSMAAYRPADPLNGMLIFGSFDQRWDMFSPDPARADGWMRGPAVLSDGSEIDLFKSAPPYDGPRYADPLYSRWVKVFERISMAANADYRLEFGRMFCRTRNLHLASGQPRLVSFEVFYTERLIGAPGREDTFTDHSLWAHTC